MKRITKSVLNSSVLLLASGLQFCGSPLGGENKVNQPHCAFKGDECLVLTMTKPQEGDSVGETVLTQGDCTANTTVLVRNNQLQNNPSKVLCGSNGTFSGNIKFKPGVTGDQTLSFSLLSSAGETDTVDNIKVNVGQVSLMGPTIEFPAEGFVVNSIPLTVTGTCQGMIVLISNTELVTNPSTGPCSSDTYAINVQFMSSPAPVTLKVISKDSVGTVSPTSIRSFTFDATAPTVTVNQTAGQVDPTNLLPIDFDVVFSEPIKAGTFSVGDITQSGTATGITWSIINSGDNQNFTLRAMAITGDGSLIPSISSDSIQDLAGNNNSASTSMDNSVTFDSTAPTVMIDQSAGQLDPTNSVPITFDVVFSEPINVGTFTVGDITQNGTATGITWSIIDSGDHQTFTLRATAVIGDGTLIPSIAAGAVQDLSGNDNSISTSTDNSVTYDTVAPTVTVDQSGSQFDPTNNLPIQFDVVFSEPINATTFTTADITQNGTATGITWAIINSGDSQNFTLRAAAITGDGTVIPSIAVSRVQDFSGNNNSASTSSDNSVTYDSTGPSVTVNQAVGQSDPTNSVPINFTVSYSEPINPLTFTNIDITQSGTATGITWSIMNSGDNQNFTLRATAVTGNGTLIPSIALNIIQDLAGNNNAASTSSDNTVTYDIVAPTVTVNQAIGQVDPTNNATISFTVVFSEAIAPATFTNADITQSGTATGVTWNAPTTANNITWTITTNAIGTNGTVQPTIAAARVTDLASNNNSASTSTDNTVTYDSVAPTLTINQGAGQIDQTNALPINFAVVFSEAINAATFTTADITQSGTATGITWSIITVSPTTYTLRATAITSDGTLIPSIGASLVQDLAGNNNSASTSTDNTVTYDITAPTLTVNQGAGQPDPTNALPINFTVVFSEAINAASFTTADITQSGTATGITWSIINVNPTTYTLRATAVTGAGTLIPSITASKLTDIAGNNNTASTSTDNSVTRDTTAPTVTVNQAAGQIDPTNNAAISFTVVFSEAIAPATFTSADITQSGTSTGVTWNAPTTGNNITWTITTNAVGTNGTVRPSIAASAVTDLAGNNNTASTSVDNTVTYDTVAPTVTINQAVGQLDPTNIVPINFTAVFSKAINAASFTAADITQSGTATGITWSIITVSATTYTVRATAVTTNGTLIPNIGASTVQDLAGNNNSASTSTDNSVTRDTVVPTVTVNQTVGQVDPTTNATISFTVVFSEPIVSATFIAADITQSGTATGVTWNAPTTSDNITWTITTSAVGTNGTVRPTIAVNKVTDLAGNNNTASTSTDNTVTYDTVAPTETVNQAAGQLDPTNAVPINFTVVFSEAINAASFTTADITQSGTATGITWSIITVSATTYTLRATAVTGNGTLIPSIGASLVQDLAGNNNTASTSTDNTIAYDNVVPTVTINQAVGQADPTNVNTISFTVIFSEPILPATFTTADITQSGTSTGVTWSAPTTSDNITWTITTSAVGINGTVKPTMTASKVTDPAGNNNTASTSTDNTVTYDTVANPPSNIIHSTLWKNTQTSPSVTWTAAIPAADVNHYDVALGTGTTGSLTSNVVTWTSIGNTTSYGGFSGLSLTECTPYYTSVRMVDNAGNISTVATTVTPFKYDATPPTNVSGLFTNTYALPNKTTKATWTVSTDNCNGLNHYDFAIGTTGVGGGQNDVAAWTNIGNVTTYKAVSGVAGFPVFTLSFGPTYYTSIRAVDGAGNISVTASSGYFLDFKYAAFTATQTTTGTNFNLTPTNLRWNQTFMDTQYFSFTAGSPTDQNITVLQAGDYLVDVTLPVTSALLRCAIRLQAKVNGTIVQGAIAESSYIRNIGANNFSSDHLHVLLPGLAANDVITFQVEGTAIAGTVTVDSQALLFIEKIDSSEKVINAEGNSNSGGTNLNTAALTNINWARTGTDRYNSTTYTHVSGNPLVTINEAGDYLVFTNIPAEDNTAAAASNDFRSEIQIAGTTINGGLARQGLISRTSGHNNSSVHWSGLVNSVTIGQTLGIGTIRDTATVSNITVTTGQQGSLYVQKITAPEIASFRGIDVNNGGVTSTNFNSSTTPRPIRWTTEDTINSSYFTHSTSTNPENITVVEDGDYYFAYNDTLNGAIASTNVTIQVYKNGVAQNGYKCSSHYIDNTNSHVNSSCSLVGLLRDVSANDVFTFRAATEAVAGMVTTNGNFAKLFIWKKK